MGNRSRQKNKQQREPLPLNDKIINKIKGKRNKLNHKPAENNQPTESENEDEYPVEVNVNQHQFINHSFDIDIHANDNIHIHSSDNIDEKNIHEKDIQENDNIDEKNMQENEEDGSDNTEEEDIQEDEEEEDGSDNTEDEDEDEVDVRAMFSDSDEETEFERQAYELNKKEAAEQEASNLELMEQAQNQAEFQFPLPDEPVDIPMINERIGQNISILSNFTAKAIKSRQEHVQLLLEDIALYYGYNLFLVEKIYELFPLQELIGFFEANQVQRPLVIRANSIRCRRRDLAQQLLARGMSIEAVKWSKVGLQVYDAPVPVGATPEYLAGYYMLQAAASFLPVIALGPQPNESILDMCAAPGGKTTYISQEMKNTGLLIANDISKDRLKGLSANAARLGCANIITTNYDGRFYANSPLKFDRVLLDAPCSGTGVISKDPSVKLQKDEQDFMFLSHTQKELILAAVDCLKINGTLVYSTCSITVEENEDVVAYCLRNRGVKIIDCGLEFGTPGFTNFRGKIYTGLEQSKRYYPHTHNLDGFFVAKLVKISDWKPTKDKVEKIVQNSSSNNEIKFDDAEDEQYLKQGMSSNRKPGQKRKFNQERNAKQSNPAPDREAKKPKSAKPVKKVEQAPIKMEKKTKKENKAAKKAALKRLLESK